MNISDDVIGTLIEAWSDDSQLDNVVFFREFPGTKQDLPLRKIYISVGVSSIVFTGEQEGNINSGEILGQAEIKSYICAPKSSTGYDCIKIFERMVLVLKSLRDIPFSIDSIKAEEIKYSQTIGGIILPIIIKVTGEIL